MGIRQGIAIVNGRYGLKKTALLSRCFFDWPVIKGVLVIFCCFAGLRTKGQTPEQIISELKSVNNKVTAVPCEAGRGMLISNKAMNIFLSNKLSSYLSDKGDLSLYKNYVTLNAAEGSIAINHNFHQPVDSDDRARSFVIVGARANVANAYAAKFSNKYFDNQLGFMLQKTWMGKPVTYYNQCGSQKMDMDAQRAVIVHSLELEIKNKAADFEQALAAVKAEEVPGQDIATARNKLRQNFYTDLRSEYLQKFSEAQSDLLIKTNNYKLITDNWTSIVVYVPIIRQKFEVSSSIDASAAQRYNYPFEFSLTHTRFWDSPKYGRFFISLNGGAFLNNSVQSGALYSVNGPSITTGVNSFMLNEGDRYIGDYRNYITPVASGKLVYIPPDSHVGVSFRIEKNFGSYQALNSILGIPIVLIDKKGVPAINFEAQLLFSDMNNSVKGSRLPYNKNAVGFTVGIPFSKVVL